jgi:hypothetical protein
LIVGHREIFKGREAGVLFSSFFSFSRDIANQGFAIFPVKVRKYIIKVLLCKNFCITLISLDKCEHFCKLTARMVPLGTPVVAILYILYVTYTF